MPPAKTTYTLPTDASPSVLKEYGIECGFIGKLQGLQYECRPDITNRTTLGKNFREKSDAVITVETRKHEALKPHKKSLMQQLFPSPEDALIHDSVVAPRPGLHPSLVCSAPLGHQTTSQRDTAYQPRATLWVGKAPDLRVLKERRISPNGGRVTDQSLCGVPSERMNGIPRIPRALPWAGMHGSVGAKTLVD